jgi:Tannase-like family of unknown function (DUF6351)
MAHRLNVNAIAIALAMSGAPLFAQTVRSGGFEVSTLSTRPDMVSGGDVLIRIVPPRSGVNDIALTVNGRAANAESQPATGAAALLVRLKDLSLGKNEIAVGYKGQKPAVQLTVVNHATAGPVLSGPRQTPFKCETQAFGFGPPLDGDCTAATRVDYLYRSTAQVPPTNPFKTFDVNAARPGDLAMTTTLDGRTVPYIVRREMGTINRAAYVIAFLHEPGTPLPDPWSPANSSWNGRLVYSFGAGCRAGYRQGKIIGGLQANRRFLEESQLSDYALASGYAVASSSLNVFDTNCADVISAETMMMVKEHFIEEFGVPRYTIGSGRSGGSMQQHLIANNYPGLLDGLIPTASFADTFTFVNHVSDCELLERAFDRSSLSWTDDQKSAVSGEANWQYCAQNGTNFRLLLVNFCDAVLTSDEIYDRNTNPKGARCSYQDNLVNIFGRDPNTGFARRPFDNVGIQYGLKAFNDEKITFEQFLDLNSRIGGHDIDGNIVSSRTVADPAALGIAFRSGRVNDAGKGMAMVPIIDVRPYTDGNGDVHDIVNSYITRARLVAANGTSGNQVLHFYEPGTDIQRVQRDNLREMDDWLAAIVKDTSAAKNPLEKIIRNRPSGVTDGCYTKDGRKIADMKRCAEMFPAYANPRLNAGMPIASTMLKCALKPVDGKDYSQALTGAQLTALKTAFPSGVCDYTRKGIDVRPPDIWLSY